MKRFISSLLFFVFFQNVSAAASLSTGLALPILPDSGETAFGFNFGVLSEASSKLYVGADLGIHFWGKAGGTNDAVTALQLLPTVVYHLKGGPKWTPYIGLSAGPYLYVSKPVGFPAGVDFALFFRPGVNWNISNSVALNLEGKFGELGGALLAMPVVSVAFIL